MRKTQKTPCFKGQNKRLSKSQRKRRPIFEPLEERALLTSYIVDTLDDSNAADGKVSLREALIAANTNLPFVDAPQGGVGPGVIDSIRFAASLNGQIIALSGLGSLPISDAVDLADSNSLPVVIDGGGQGVFIVANNTPNASISNIVIRNGQSTEGGGLRVGANSSVQLSNTVFQNNRADNGGAIFNAGGSLTLIGTTISNNRTIATNGSGGGIFVQSGSVILVNSQISFNSALRAGGGIEITNGTLSLTRTNLINNDVKQLAPRQ